MKIYKSSNQIEENTFRLELDYSNSSGILTSKLSYYTPIIPPFTEPVLDANGRPLPPEVPSIELTKATLSSANMSDPIDTTFDLNAIFNDNGFADNTVWSFYSSGEYYNIFADTYVRKEDPTKYKFKLNKSTQILFELVIPCASDSSTFSLVTRKTPKQELVLTGDLELQSKILASREDYTALRPTINQISAPARNGNILSFDVTTTLPIKTYYTSSLGVVLTPQLSNGSGTVLVDVSNIPSGTEGTLKAGTKFFTNIKSKDFTT